MTLNEDSAFSSLKKKNIRLINRDEPSQLQARTVIRQRHSTAAKQTILLLDIQVPSASKLLRGQV